MLRMAGMRVLVTAAAHGIGRACAERAAEEGALVVATDIDEDALRTLDVEATCAVDGTDANAVAKCVEQLGPFDSLIHCIGYVHHGSILECDADSWRRSFSVNVDTFLHVVRAVLPPMIAAGDGSITCISSVASCLKGLPHRFAYGASKAALVGMTKSIAADYATQGIRCNAVCPGTITSPSLLARVEELGRGNGGFDEAMARFTARQPLGRLGSPDEVANLCIYLASGESRFVTGQAFAIDGGITI